MILLAVMLGLTALARRLLVPYPILLVLGGLALGFVPGLTRVPLAPELVFFVFLPPILWAAAYFTSFRDFRRNLRPIGLLAVGLVLATTVAVAWVARLIIPGLDWAPALVLGAIVSPPDAVAATAIGRRLAIPRRIVTILEGESLVNDASALVLYRAAVAATVTGSFLLRRAALDFVVAAVLGIVVGLLVGWVARLALARLEDSFVEIGVTLLAPYVAWVGAEAVHASGVLACVAGGIYIRQRYSTLATPVTRLQARAVWEQLVFLLNGIIFIAIGLQLGALHDLLQPGQFGTVLWWAAAVSLTAIVVRLLWVPVATVVPRWLSPALRARDPMPPARAMFLIGWVGMRGIVSLASALALPETTATGAPFPFRTEIILIAFGVIVATLVLQGLSLGPIVRRLGFPPEETEQVEEAEARAAGSRAALERLEALAGEPWAAPGRVRQLRTFYAERGRRYSVVTPGSEDCSAQEAAAYRRLRHAALSAERLALVALRDREVISDEVLHRLEQELGIEALRLGTGDLRPA